MRIAKIREFRGDITAKALLASLVKEAKEIGVELPKWSCLKHLREVSQKNIRAKEKVDYKKYDPLIRKVSRFYELPPALIKAVIHAESAFVNDAISKKGAQGLMQLMPDTADEIGVHNAFDPRANIFGGSKLLRRYLNEFGSLKKTLIAYNAGPAWVRKRKGIPKETKIYIKRVINYYHIYKRGM
jgi:soluble lytic murein transglycosylase-like protein